jgi:hypothetical protein
MDGGRGFGGDESGDRVIGALDPRLLPVPPDICDTKRLTVPLAPHFAYDSQR